jgi:hypothetical protein
MRESRVPNARIFAFFFSIRVDFCISKTPLNTREHLELTTTVASTAIHSDTTAAISCFAPRT